MPLIQALGYIYILFFYDRCVYISTGIIVVLLIDIVYSSWHY